ncbi:unnamed protein product [Brachionus calyciflorus]|uniref:BPTI/Kunitz inhibitor domain-containing protein n=1 Tax=Brachionus calyciflorus TaxID=104777 RepID=A0A813MEW3_9BILA|nr:unnamed protein product [Brachionus calyciflorus]
MKLIKRTLVHLTVILVLISLTSQFRIKRQEGPSETDNAEPLDESLRTDHLPLHDETELAVVETDVSLTPDDQIVESTPPNDEFLSKPDDESESASESSSLESSTLEENMTNSDSQSIESEMTSESQSEETNTYPQDEALETQQVDTTEVNSLSETDIPETTVAISSTETQESEATNALETSETNEVVEDTTQTAETTVESGNTELIEETTQLAETTVEPKKTEEIDSHEIDETTESYTENEELTQTTVTPKDETTQVVSETHATTEAKTTEDSTENETTQVFEEVTEEKNEEQTEQLSTEEADHDHTTLHNNDEQFIEDPSDEQLLESNKIANDYEDEITTTKSPTTKAKVWFKPTKSMRINDSYDDESHITANCPSLNCEFGYKTDLYGKPICACFNPCHEKKCGDHVCKIEKLSETKFIGACYDPRKIERPLYCHLPLATGTCKNYTSRFYFNSFMQKCSHFVYTGCGGNQNNFDTWEKCEMECNTCSLPAVRGPCKGNIIRYHYDPMKRECVAFNWGGCKGNENNFQTRKHCEDSCIFRKEGALFLHGMPVRIIRKYHQKEKN